MSSGEKSGGGINISAGGDVVGVGVSGSGNVIGKNVIVGSGTLTISPDKLASLPPTYASALQQFSSNLNSQMQSNQVPQQTVQDIGKELDQFVQAVGSVKPDTQPGVLAQKNLNTRFTGLAAKILGALPKTAQVVAAFTPLAPISGLIGESVQSLVEAIQKEV